MSAAGRVAHAAETIRVSWERRVVVDPQTDAAQALEDRCQLLDPEVADELQRMRAEVSAAKLRGLLAPSEPVRQTTANGGYPPALPWARRLDADDLEGFFADLADAATGTDDLTTLANVEHVIAMWQAIGDAQHAHNTAPGPGVVS